MPGRKKSPRWEDSMGLEFGSLRTAYVDLAVDICV